MTNAASRMATTRPFLSIAAIRRSGSTILSEMLTDPPRAFIFREPRMARGVFDIKPGDAELMAEHGIDLPGFVRRWSGFRRRWMVHGFQHELMPALLERFDQIGVKEISHRHWRRYDRAFPDMRIIALARDPRDIYLSLIDRAEKDAGTARAVATDPGATAAEINRQFRFLREMVSERGALRVTYEQLCTDPEVFHRIATHCETPLERPGAAGRFNASNTARADEAAMHQGRVTKARVDRWKTEPNERKRAGADEVFRLTREFAEFWGYTEGGSAG